MSKRDNVPRMTFSPPEKRLFTRLNNTAFSRPFFIGARSLTLIFVTVLLACLFIPWQQTSRGKGEVIAYDPNERAHPITAMVSGRIKSWYVNDGDFVNKGSKIVELIDNDPNLIDRVRQNREAARQQLTANERIAGIAKLNYERQKELYEKGLTAQKDFEKARIEYEKLMAKIIDAQTKLNQMDIKISQQATQVIKASHDGTVTHLHPGSLSTRIKVGDVIATFVPELINPAVVMYIDPNDMQLVRKGRKVRLQFQGWPSVQFSGWPSVAVGTFGGVVSSVDQHIDPKNGQLRIIVLPDPDDEPWPKSTFLRVGTSVYGTILLNQVPLGYEWWRRLNNFPPRGDKLPPTVKVTK